MRFRSMLSALLAAMAALVLAFASPRHGEGRRRRPRGRHSLRPTPSARTLTVDVTKPNGSVQDSRSTTLADLLASVPATA